MKKIYLAIAYTGHEQESFEEVNKIAGKLMSDGYLVFSPISHTHSIASQCNLPSGADFWLDFDFTFIEWCDELWVCDFKDWTKSKGVNAEITMAKKLNKKIVFMEDL